MNEDELIDGIKRRVAYALAVRDADTSWYIDHLRSMQRFVVEWEQRNRASVAERVYGTEVESLVWENDT